MSATSAAVLPGGVEVDEELAFFVERARPEFLAEIGWDRDAQVLSPPQDHPVFGWWVCRVAACGRPTSYVSRLCVGCTERHQRSHHGRAAGGVRAESPAKRPAFEDLKKKYTELQAHCRFLEARLQIVAAAANLLALENAALSGQDAEEAKVRIIPGRRIHMP